MAGSKHGRVGGGSVAASVAKKKSNLSSDSSTPTNHDSPPSVGLQRRSSSKSTTNLAPSAAQRSLHLPPLNHRGNSSSSSHQNDGGRQNHQQLHRYASPPPPLFNPEGQLELEDEDEEEESEAEDVGATEEAPSENLHLGAHMSLNELLAMPGRDRALPTLSPDEEKGLWFDRDTELVRVSAKIVQDNFGGPWYSWLKLPQEARDLFFCQLAHRYNWDPVITPLVRDEFDEIVKRRLKGMISYVRRERKRPSWIRTTLWTEMEASWSTKAAKKRSKTASKSRKSNRNGLGIYKHTGGPKSTAMIRRQMEKEKGREVSVGEVFLKTHAKKDGEIVDGKAKKVLEVYEQNLQTSQSELSVDPSMASDGASRTPQLTKEEKDAIFYKSNLVSDRGVPYGLGSLAKRKRNKSIPVPPVSPTILALEQELKETKAQMAAQKEASQNQVELFIKYLKTKDPELPEWLVPHEGGEPADPPADAHADQEEPAFEDALDHVNTPSTSNNVN